MVFLSSKMAEHVTDNEERSRVGLKLLPASSALRISDQNPRGVVSTRRSADRTRLASTVGVIVEEKRLPRRPSAAGELSGDTLTDLTVDRNSIPGLDSEVWHPSGPQWLWRISAASTL